MTAARLLEWVRREGGVVADLHVAGSADQRKVKIGGALDAGAVALHVPRALLVTEHVVAASEVGRRIAAARPQLTSPQSVFAAWLLAERELQRSRFAPYLAALPESLGIRPAGFGPSTRALLAGTNALAMLEAQAAGLAADHRELSARVPSFAGGVTLAAFTWARLAVTSRVFGLRIHGEPVDALVPVADLLDHDLDPATEWAYEDASDGFAMRTVRRCAAGAELTDTYGPKSNARFLVNYGFVLDDNPADEAAVIIDAHPDAGDLRRTGLARALDLALAAGARYLIAADERSGARLLSALRLGEADARELAAIAVGVRCGGTAIGALSAATERRVQRRLAALLTAARARLDGSRDGDERMLARGGWPAHVRAALVVRAGEKRVLRTWQARARSGTAQAGQGGVLHDAAGDQLARLDLRAQA